MKTKNELNQNQKSENEFQLNFDPMEHDDFMQEIPKKAVAKSADPQLNMALKNQQAVAPVEKETEELDNMAKNNREIDNYYQEQMDKNWTFSDKLMNRPIYQEVQKVKQNLLKASSDYRMKFYTTMLNARLNSLTEKCNAGILMIQSHYRQAVASFVMAKMQLLIAEVKDRQMEFIEMMKQKHDYVESLENYPSLKVAYEKKIFEEEERHLQFLDNLVIHFENIIQQQVQQYS